MPPNACPFCEQINAPDAKFCNACGGALHLAPCPRCGAVSDVAASACYQCKAPLPGRKGESEPAQPPATEPPQPSRLRPAALVAAVALAAVVVLGYYGYRQSSLVDVPQPGASNSGGTANAAPQAPKETPRPVNPAAAPPEAPVAERAPAEETEPRADVQPEESRRPNAAAGLIARPRGDRAGKAPGQAPQRKEVCTQAVEALGLCTMTPEERKLAESVAALKAASVRPEASDPGKSEAQEASRQEPCTEAVEALGLCARGSTEGRQ